MTTTNPVDLKGVRKDLEREVFRLNVAANDATAERNRVKRKLEILDMFKVSWTRHDDVYDLHGGSASVLSIQIPDAMTVLYGGAVDMAGAAMLEAVILVLEDAMKAWKPA